MFETHFFPIDMKKSKTNLFTILYPIDINKFSQICSKFKKNPFDMKKSKKILTMAVFFYLQVTKNRIA